MKNYLKNKTVYLCGPIVGVDDDGIGWRTLISGKLEKLGINILDPCKKAPVYQDLNTDLGEVGKDKKKFKEIILRENWKQLKEDFWPIVRYDLKCVDKSDFLIFYYDPTVSTVGSIHELVVATFEKKNILLFYKKEHLDSFNPWIATFIKEHHFFHNWQDMFNYLDQVNNGKFDTSLWVI